MFFLHLYITFVPFFLEGNRKSSYTFFPPPRRRAFLGTTRMMRKQLFPGFSIALFNVYILHILLLPDGRMSRVSTQTLISHNIEIFYSWKFLSWGWGDCDKREDCKNFDVESNSILFTIRELSRNLWSKSIILYEVNLIKWMWGAVLLYFHSLIHFNFTSFIHWWKAR